MTIRIKPGTAYLFLLPMQSDDPKLMAALKWSREPTLEITHPGLMAACQIAIHKVSAAGHVAVLLTHRRNEVMALGKGWVTQSTARARVVIDSTQKWPVATP
ncbi:hypothetical protein LCGC14_1018360 [marine sediment metagenome]|uniref:Uncharacterized protein n=1 Tax=marine sediment metagenome TaxID=412755 RepID=A0A0F9R475_9ZZZZ